MTSSESGQRTLDGDAFALQFDWGDTGIRTYWDGRASEADPSEAAIIRDRDTADLIARGLEGMYSATVSVVPWSNDL